MQMSKNCSSKITVVPWKARSDAWQCHGYAKHFWKSSSEAVPSMDFSG